MIDVSTAEGASWSRAKAEMREASVARSKEFLDKQSELSRRADKIKQIREARERLKAETAEKRLAEMSRDRSTSLIAANIGKGTSI